MLPPPIQREKSEMNISQDTRPFLDYIHTFRGFAIMLIVAVHLTYPIESSDPHIYRILIPIFGNSTILFVFISGFLFKYLLDKFRMKTYLRKKLSFVILPYLFMSIPALFLYALEFPYAQYNLEMENDVAS